MISFIHFLNIYNTSLIFTQLYYKREKEREMSTIINIKILKYEIFQKKEPVNSINDLTCPVYLVKLIFVILIFLFQI